MGSCYNQGKGVTGITETSKNASVGEFAGSCGTDAPIDSQNKTTSVLAAAQYYLDGKMNFPIVKNIIFNKYHAATRKLEHNLAVA